MKLPYPGFAPPDLDEVDSMTIWPTIGAHPLGRLIGRLCANKIGVGEFFTLGKVWTLVTIPLSLVVFFWQLMPYICRRYTLSNRRIIIRRGLQPLDAKWVDLDGFDTITIEVLPGQEWLHSGELIFKRGGSKVLHLSGVSRPAVFRHVCLDAQKVFLCVRKVVEEQVAVEA
jgi:hypothetical protein